MVFATYLLIKQHHRYFKFPVKKVTLVQHSVSPRNKFYTVKTAAINKWQKSHLQQKLFGVPSEDDTPLASIRFSAPEAIQGNIKACWSVVEWLLLLPYANIEEPRRVSRRTNPTVKGVYQQKTVCAVTLTSFKRRHASKKSINPFIFYTSMNVMRTTDISHQTLVALTVSTLSFPLQLLLQVCTPQSETVLG